MAANEKYLTKSDIEVELVWEAGEGESSVKQKGGNGTAFGDNSAVEGYYTTARNKSEHAGGQYNVSHSATTEYGSSGNTQHSVGIGTSSASTKNAFEIMQNGDVYVYGVGGYTGTTIGSSVQTLQKCIGKMEEITWSALKSLRDSSGLTPGMQYRITDYVTKVSSYGTLTLNSANRQFDVIVVADSNNKLNEHARATWHGNTFSESNLAIWELKYCLDNDNKKFLWADTTNGKGVIYYMKDEFGNECPYDFKNIRYVKNDTSYYTFAYDEESYLEDASLNYSDLYSCVGNKISDYKSIQWDGDLGESYVEYYLPNILLKTDGISMNFNTFAENCYDIYMFDSSDNSFGYGCYNINLDEALNNVFGIGCHHIYMGFDASYNVICDYCTGRQNGNAWENSTIDANAKNNILSNNCSGFYIGNNSSNNVFGENCTNVYIDEDCFGNIFESECSNISINENCRYNKFAGGCHHIYFSDGISANCNNYFHITFEGGNEYIYLYAPNYFDGYQYVTISKGVKGTSSNYKTITDNNYNQDYLTIYQPANSQVISV